VTQRARAQVSSSYITGSTTKCKQIFSKQPKDDSEPWSVLFAASGDAYLIDEVFEQFRFYLRQNIEPVTENPSLSFMVHRHKLGDIAYNTYKKYKDRDVSDPRFTILLGAADKFTGILEITYEGKHREITDFCIIGSGQVTGGELLLRELYREKVNVTETARLTSIIIRLVGKTDPYVGGNIDLKFCRDRTSWIFTKPDEKILDISEKRWEILKSIWWKMQEDSAISDKLIKLLSED